MKNEEGPLIGGKVGAHDNLNFGEAMNVRFTRYVERDISDKTVP